MKRKLDFKRPFRKSLSFLGSKAALALGSDLSKWRSEAVAHLDAVYAGLPTHLVAELCARNPTAASALTQVARNSLSEEQRAAMNECL